MIICISCSSCVSILNWNDDHCKSSIQTKNNLQNSKSEIFQIKISIGNQKKKSKNRFDWTENNGILSTEFNESEIYWIDDLEFLK